MLKHIPFYASLIGAELIMEDLETKKATQSHVLVYGAIEAHSMGQKGCVASNKTIAAETGLSTSRVASLISELKQALWLEIIMDDANHRLQIIPNLTLAVSGNPPLPPVATPLAASGNIEYSLENNREKTKAKDSASLALQADPLKEKSSAKKESELLQKIIEIINPKEKITEDRLRVLRGRMKDYTDDEIIDAAKCLSQSTWHKENKQMTVDNLIVPSKFGRWYQASREAPRQRSAF